MKILLTSLLLALVALLLPAMAAGSQVQESILMDDDRIVYEDDAAKLDANLKLIKALGADRIRVSLYWSLVAPDAKSERRPDFDATRPEQYPEQHWARYDRILSLALQNGLEVYWNVSSPYPRWATGKPTDADIKSYYKTNIEDNFQPDTAEYGAFVTAVGRRYSGSYVSPEGQTLPAVRFWSLTNEPNHPIGLTPQWRPDPQNQKRMVPASPRIYRELVDAGFGALAATGHGPDTDTVLLGETSPHGDDDRGVTNQIRPLEFIRELYCLKRDFRPWSGRAAKLRGCPEDAAAGQGFATAHPGLFAQSGWAHHPYPVGNRFRRQERHKDDVGLLHLPRLTRTLDRAAAAWGRPRALPVYSTEFGFQSNPPDPFGVSLSRQAQSIAEGDYIAFKNPRLASVAQFQLMDSGPLTDFPAGDPRRWGLFQSGLLTADGREKPAYDAYRLPIHLRSRRRPRGGRFEVFGQLRAAPNNTSLSVEVQLRPKGRRSFRKVKALTTINPRGYFLTSIPAQRTGSVRLLWTDPVAARKLASRSVPVQVTR